MMIDNVKLVQRNFSRKTFDFHRRLRVSFQSGKESKIGTWANNTAYSMINDFNSGTVAWTDWNMLLDETGGPNHVGNFCFAPVHADTRTGELIYTNSYYYIGHFSKFIKPGAKRIATSPSRSALISTAFQNPDGKIAVVVMNKRGKGSSVFPMDRRKSRRNKESAAFDSDAGYLKNRNAN